MHKGFTGILYLKAVKDGFKTDQTFGEFYIKFMISAPSRHDDRQNPAANLHTLLCVNQKKY